MSYREQPRRRHSYDPNWRRRGSPQFRSNFGYRHTHKKEFLGHTLTKDVDEYESTHVPAEIKENSENSLTGKVDNGVIGVGGSLTNKKERETKF